MKDCFLMSVAGRGMVPSIPGPSEWEFLFCDKTVRYPRLQVDSMQRAAYIHPPFDISAMLMPWEYDEHGEFDDLKRMVTKTGRFVARAFIINGQGRVTMLYASDADKGFEDASDEFTLAFESNKAELRPARAMGFNKCLAAAEVSFDYCEKPRVGRWEVSGDANLNTHIDNQDSHAVAEVLHYLLSLR